MRERVDKLRCDFAKWCCWADAKTDRVSSRCQQKYQDWRQNAREDSQFQQCAAVSPPGLATIFRLGSF
jgi:hypothetical protein